MAFRDADRCSHSQFNWPWFLNQELTTQETAWSQRNLATGLPTASQEFIEQLEQGTIKFLVHQPQPGTASSAIMMDLTENRLV